MREILDTPLTPGTGTTRRAGGRTPTAAVLFPRCGYGMMPHGVGGGCVVRVGKGTMLPSRIGETGTEDALAASPAIQHQGRRLVRQGIRSLLGFAFSVFFIVVLLRSLRWQEIGRSFRAADVAPLLVAGGMLVLIYGLLALRWRVLLGAEKATLRDTFTALNIGACCNVVLPVRGGDVVRTLLLGRQAGLPASYVFASVLLEKLLDVAALIVLATTAVFVVPLPRWFETMLLLASAVVGTGIVGCVAIRHSHLHTVPAPIRRFLPAPMVLRAEGLLVAFHAGLRPLDNVRVMAQSVGLSFAVWLGISFVSFFTGLALHLPALTLAEMVIATAVISLGQVIPSSPGAIGTYEFLGVVALALFGRAQEPALEFAIALHLLSIVVQVALGAASMAHLGLSPRHAVRLSAATPLREPSREAAS